ncbi:tRNA lysidine(34) synthetase TilS, partial [Lactobacillus sp. XV13L]|nr:tRNA lysidine(34) synthetase TilS [Lactobacillus sp. XV13L]
MCLKNKTLVVATSGGPDSMALLDMLNTIKDDQHFHLIAAHLDHRLRPDSFREAAAIDQYCGKKQIKVVHGTWPQALHPQSGVEAAARRYRYDFLAQVMHKNAGDYLLTAHHCDDLLENILIKFIRSGDPSEMNSLQAVSGWRGALLLRPLLTLEKADLLAYVRSRGIPFVIDETNNEDEALRNRLRHQVIPVLKRENPHIGRSALRFNRRVNQMASIVARTFTQLGQ